MRAYILDGLPLPVCWALRSKIDLFEGLLCLLKKLFVAAASPIPWMTAGECRPNGSPLAIASAF